MNVNQNASKESPPNASKPPEENKTKEASKQTEPDVPSTSNDQSATDEEPIGAVSIFSRVSLKPNQNVPDNHPNTGKTCDQPAVITIQPQRIHHEMEQIYLTTTAIKSSECHVPNPIVTMNEIPPTIPIVIPPSYSTVIKFPPPEQRLRFPKAPMSSSDFTGRIPPPTYAEVEGVTTELWSNDSSEEMLFGPDPQYAGCPRCTAIVITETRYATSKLTHFTAIGLCLLGCWPCCLLPYFMESCKDIYHYCPICHHCFGVYRPW